MKITVFIIRTKETKELEIKDFNDLFSKLNINPEASLVIRNNELITDKTKLNNNDQLRILPVISGG
ncbi:MoaD/ThiS family protein [Candidatus Woesearchaeota archaeon]|nr:MoaD/ThiS family protein [Candidatus Woesearchaeota archaeon]